MIIIHVRILRQALQDELPPVWFAIAHMIYMSEFYGRPSQDELPTETVVESVLAELFRSSDFKTSAEVSAGHTGTKPQNGCQLRQHGE